MTIHYTPGQERKKLAAAVAQAAGTGYRYAGAPTMAYIAGEFAITREGALTGPDDRGLVEALTRQGFEPAEEIYDVEPAGQAAEAEGSDHPDRLVVEVPLEGFDDASLDRLHKLITSKAPLLKMALGVDPLHVQVQASHLAFPWFPFDGNAAAYAQLAQALCRTAREKTRVNAKPQDSYPNPKFSLRVFLVSLGLSGDEYKTLRRLLLTKLPGNSSWPSGSDPRKAVLEGGADNA